MKLTMLRSRVNPARAPDPPPTPDPRAALARLVPLPLGEVSTVLGTTGIARHAAQEALNDGLRGGELRLAHADGTVLVVAQENAP